MTIRALALTARAPIEHVTTCPAVEQLPSLVRTPTGVNPFGSVSVARTPVAPFGPALLTASTYTTGSPMTACFGPNFSRRRSAWAGVATTRPPARVPELPVKSLLPPYDAETVWVPCASAVSVTEATPPVSVTGPPTLAPSTASCTVPPGVPDPGGTAVTVTVKVTVVPAIAGLADAAIWVVVAALPTTCPPGSVPELFVKLQ